MKKTIKQFLGLVSLAGSLAASLVIASPAQAYTWVSAPINGTPCMKAIGGPFPADGHYYDCGDSNRYHGDAFSSLGILLKEPFPILAALQNVNGKVPFFILYRDWATWRNTYNQAQPAGTTTNLTLGITDPQSTPPASSVMQFLDASNMPTGNNRGTVYDTVIDGAMMHETGHLLDNAFKVSGQAYPSSLYKTGGSTPTMYNAKFKKDVIYVNALRPCKDIFFADQVNGAYICQNGVLIAPYKGLSNIAVLQKIYPDYFNVKLVGAIQTYAEAWAEQYVIATGHQTSNFIQGQAYDSYLDVGSFDCTLFYVERMRATAGHEPTPAEYTAASLGRCN